MAEWISVSERRPTPFVSVLVFVLGESPHPMVHEGFVNRAGEWITYNCPRVREPGEITHWMPMPLPPDEVLEYLLKKGALANDG